MRRTITAAIAIVFLLSFGTLLRGGLPTFTTGTWNPVGTISSGRSGAASVLLADGRVLITGGLDENGAPLATAEFFTKDGEFIPAQSMSVPRSGHAAISLANGEVLVTGGNTSGGVTNAAEVFDPTTNTWRTLPATMVEARSRHTMAQINDETVVVVGGDGSSGPVSGIEAFDLSSGRFAYVASLATPRRDAAVAALPNGRVLIAGGVGMVDGSAVPLASTEIFTYNAEFATGAVAAGPNMAVARAGATATTTYDGVAIVGGNDGDNDLGTAEILSQWTSAFRTVAGGTPRSKGLAILLPHNGSVLITGGTAGPAVDLLQPWANNKVGAFASALATATNHGNGFVSATGLEGLALAAGGKGGNSAELYRFPTISTDKDDYAPGTTVVMTGTGFQPGETVTLHMHQWVNQTLNDYPDYIVAANAEGAFVFSGYAPTQADLNSRYHLTAVGQSSGLQAQTVFTDATSLKSVSVGLQSPTTVVPGGKATYTVTVGFNGNGSGSTACVAELSVLGLPTGTSLESFTPSTVSGGSTTTVPSTLIIDTTANASSGSFTVRATGQAGTNCAGDTKNYTATLTLTAQAIPTITWPNPADITYGTPLSATQLNATASVPGKFAYTPPSGTVLNAGSNQALSVTFTPTDSSAYQSVTQSTAINVNQANAAISIVAYDVKYDGVPHTATGTAKGVNDEDLSDLLTLSGTTHTNAGDYTGDAWSFAGNVNYKSASGTVHDHIDNAATVTAMTCPTSVPYNGSAQEPCTAKVTGPGLDQILTVTYTNNTNAGTATASAVFNGDSNHGSSSSSKTFEITKAQVTATAGSYSGIYDGSAHSPLDCTVTGAYKGDLTCTNDPASVGPNAGSGEINPVVNGTGLANFEITSVKGTFSIARAPSEVTITCPTGVTYNGAAQRPCSALATGDGALNEALSVTYSNNTNAGTATANAAFDGDTNHTPSSNSKTFEIAKAPVSAAAGSYSGTYDGSAHAPSKCDVSGDYTGDLTCVNDPASVGPNVSSGDVTPIISGTGLSNFEITHVKGSYSITRAPVTATAGSYSGTYDGTAHSPVACEITGPYIGNLTCANDPSSVGPDVGSGEVNALVSGVGIDNFKITIVKGAYSIAKAPVTATAGGYSHSYDGAAHSPSQCSVTGSYTGDLTCVNDPLQVGPNVGSGEINPVVAGSGLTNFEITQVKGSYSITKAPVTATAGGYSHSYDGAAHSPAACEVTGTYIGNLACANDPSLVGPTVGSGEVNPVVSGTGLANFEVATVKGLYSITKAPVTATAGSYTGVYDRNTHSPLACAVTGSYTGSLVCINDPASVGPNVSSGVTNPIVSGPGLDNFEITAVKGSFTISKATPVITWLPPADIYYGTPLSAKQLNATASYLGETVDGTFTYAPPPGTVLPVGVAQTLNLSFAPTDDTNYNSNSKTVPINVLAWTLRGFYQPVTMSGGLVVWNTIKGGSTVPLKFQVYAGTVEQTSTAAVKNGSIAAYVVQCDSSGVDDPVDMFTNTGGTTLRYDGQFIQNWQTPKQANQCYLVQMTTQDGSSLKAYFKTK